FVQALRAHGGEAAVDRAFAHPPRTTLAVLEPGRYLAGDPLPAPIALPPPASGARRILDTTFGAVSLDDLTGRLAVAEAWRGGRIAVDVRGGRARVLVRLRSADPAATLAALREVLPAGVTLHRHGGLLDLDAAGASGAGTVAPGP